MNIFALHRYLEPLFNILSEISESLPTFPIVENSSARAPQVCYNLLFGVGPTQSRSTQAARVRAY